MLLTLFQFGWVLALTTQMDTFGNNVFMVSSATMSLIHHGHTLSRPWEEISGLGFRHEPVHLLSRDNELINTRRQNNRTDSKPVNSIQNKKEDIKIS